MDTNIIATAIAVVCGLFVAFANYIISKLVLIKAPEKYSLVTVVRQIFQVGFLVSVYFIGEKIQVVNNVYILVGAVLGMTVPMIYFTKKLLSLNQSVNKKKTEKEDDVNG